MDNIKICMYIDNCVFYLTKERNSLIIIIILFLIAIMIICMILFCVGEIWRGFSLALMHGTYWREEKQKKKNEMK